MRGKKIILGVTGSIAAYKSILLARTLIQRDTEIRVAMTPAASHFIAPLTFASIAKSPVALSMYPEAGREPASGSWHIDWALWADAMVIAPASAATIAKLASGLSDNALTTIATALRGTLFVAPAMDSDMYAWPALERNLDTLRSFGVQVLPVGHGELASGLIGPGRMMEPEEIVAVLERHFADRERMDGLRVLVTAGPTHEPIDAVRYIANHSSGRMGWALAEEARDRGAQVTLVAGPTPLPAPHGVETVRVTTAAEMGAAVDRYSESADVVVAAAAVADFTPAEPHGGKLKRRTMSEGEMNLVLAPTRDILRTLGERKRHGQILVGFALETSGLVESARAKLFEKRCDLVVANPANEEDAGFGGENNRITLVTPGDTRALPTMSKHECARAILDEVERIREGAASGSVDAA